MIRKKYKEILENIKYLYSQKHYDHEVLCDVAIEQIMNMSVETLRKGFVEYFDRNTVSFAGKKVLKLPYGEYDPVDGLGIYREKPTLYVSISHDNKDGFSMSTPDDEKYADAIHTSYKFEVASDRNGNITNFKVSPEMYYTT